MSWIVVCLGFFVGFFVARSFVEGVDERLRRASSGLEARLAGLPAPPEPAAPWPSPTTRRANALDPHRVRPRAALRRAHLRLLGRAPSSTHRHSTA